MYWKLFEQMFEAHAKRKAIERCIAVRDAITAGLWANTNLDSQKEGEQSPRNAVLAEIEKGFRNAVIQIRTGERDKSEDIDWDNPFFAASKAPRINTDEIIREGMTSESAELLKQIDQAAG